MTILMMAERDTRILQKELDFIEVVKLMQGKWWNVYNVFAACFFISVAVAPYMSSWYELGIAIVGSSLGPVGYSVISQKIKQNKLFVGAEGGVITYETRLTHDGISTTVGGTTTFAAWRPFTSVTETPAAFVLKRRDFSCTYVFKRDLTEPWDPITVKGVIQQLMQGIYPQRTAFTKEPTTRSLPAFNSPNREEGLGGVWPPPPLADTEQTFMHPGSTLVGFANLVNSYPQLQITRLPASYASFLITLAQAYFFVLRPSHKATHVLDQFVECLLALACVFILYYVIDGMRLGNIVIDRSTGQILRNGRQYARITDLASVAINKSFGGWNVVLDFVNGKRLRILGTGAFIYQAEARRCAQIISDFLGPKSKS